MRKEVIAYLVVAALVVIAGAAIAPIAGAAGYSIRPLTDFEGDTLQAGTTHAYKVWNEEKDYILLLMYLSDAEGEMIPVQVYGYFQQNLEGTQVVYSIWIPEKVPTGEYSIHISVNRRAYVTNKYYLEDGTECIFKGYYGPFEELYPIDANVVVINNNDYYMGTIANSAFERSEFALSAADLCAGSVGEIEKYLTPGQRQIIEASLKVEADQKGL